MNRVKIVEINVMTGRATTLREHIPSGQAESAKRFYIDRLYKANRYADYVIDVRPER